MLTQLVAGVGLVVGGSALAIRAAHRKPVPADVAAQLRAALGNPTTMAQLDAAYSQAKHPYQHQVAIASKASRATSDGKTPADVAALYNAALQSGNVQTMQSVAKQMAAKHPVLAGNLNDVAKILGG